MAASGLPTSCATPAARRPTVASFSCCTRCSRCSRRLFVIWLKRSLRSEISSLPGGTTTGGPSSCPSPTRRAACASAASSWAVCNRARATCSTRKPEDATARRTSTESPHRRRHLKLMAHASRRHYALTPLQVPRNEHQHQHHHLDQQALQVGVQ